jgi:uncharacterized cupin superfamily protein
VPKLDLAAIKPRQGPGYPAPFSDLAKTRIKHALGDAGSLADFGVNLVTLPPGNWSSQRHWHSAEDEFVYVLSGELVLITEAGEQRMAAGDCAAFAKNTPDGHHLVNKSASDAVYLEIGSRAEDDAVFYPDIDMQIRPGEGYSRKDGTAY